MIGTEVSLSPDSGLVVLVDKFRVHFWDCPVLRACCFLCSQENWLTYFSFPLNLSSIPNMNEPLFVAMQPFPRRRRRPQTPPPPPPLPMNSAAIFRARADVKSQHWIWSKTAVRIAFRRRTSWIHKCEVIRNFASNRSTLGIYYHNLVAITYTCIESQAHVVRKPSLIIKPLIVMLFS